MRDAPGTFFKRVEVCYICVFNSLKWGVFGVRIGDKRAGTHLALSFVERVRT